MGIAPLPTDPTKLTSRSASLPTAPTHLGEAPIRPHNTPTRGLVEGTQRLDDSAAAGSSQPGSSELIGRVLDGKYRIDAPVGHGGMATIYRARHLALRRDVAIKILREKTRSAAQMGARFEREAYSASRLNHPNCLQVTDFGNAGGGILYMVMELLDGCDLNQYLDGPIDPERASRYMVQILRGLQHAHENGVIHRDIKPQNIFVTRDHQDREVLKLVDFGLAKVFDGEGDDHTMTQVGMVFGTPLYMSPEQAVGMPDIDARTDLYSAGALFYWMLAGRPPFEAKDMVSLLRMHVAAPLPPIHERLPKRVRAVLHILLEKHRDDRYDSAKQALAALAPRPGNDRAPRPNRRRRTDSHDVDSMNRALAELRSGPQFVGIDGSPYDPTPPQEGLTARPGMDVRASSRLQVRRVSAPPPPVRRELPPLTLTVLVPYGVLSLITFAWRR
jgi:serine/threonine protein kinase